MTQDMKQNLDSQQFSNQKGLSLKCKSQIKVTQKHSEKHSDRSKSTLTGTGKLTQRIVTHHGFLAARAKP